MSMSFPSWDEMSRRDQLLSTISDVHKDVYGCRYRGNCDHMSDDDLEKFLDRLYEDLEVEMEYEKQRELEAIQRFEKLIATTIESGAGDRETAIRWLKEIDPDDPYMMHDEGYFCYEHGLPYNYFKSEVA